MSKLSAPECLEGLLNVEPGGRPIELRSHRMVFNPTAFGLTLAKHLTPRLEALQAGARVCELGTGSGVLSILAGLTGARVTGLDVNQHAVEMSRANWARNGLDPEASDFRHSSLLSALKPEEAGSFELLWSNPPVLPQLASAPDEPVDRDGFEVSGPTGRRVLDTVLREAQRYLAPNGRVLTIATSLQGWDETEALLKGWARWELLEEVELALTDECGAPYVEWWLKHTAPGDSPRVYQRDGVWWHKVWFVELFKSA